MPIQSESTPLPATSDSQQRPFTTIPPNDQTPKVRAILPIDGANAFFLNHRGQIGVAKFSPGLSQIGWQLYSDVKLNALPSLSLGPNYSLITASPRELTQAFDTDRNANLDFFQALLRDWSGRTEGVSITAGPVADGYGRILFALSPHSLGKDDAPKARLMAWSPASGRAEAITESQLPIESFAVAPNRLLAARLNMPDYTDGYFLSLTTINAPADDSKSPSAPTSAPSAPTTSSPAPSAPPAPSVPSTLPSLIIPAELTDHQTPIHPTFYRENGRDKLLLACPGSKRIIEIVPTESDGAWQGSILLRGITEKEPYALATFAPGMLLGGGDQGFFAIQDDPKTYRIVRIDLASDGIVLEFSHSVDRYEALKAENFSAKAIAFGGGETAISVDPMIESDGKVVVLRCSEIAPGQVIRVVCLNLPSESGEKLLSASAFYTLHAR